MPMLPKPINPAGGAVTVGLRRPTVVPAPSAASPELSNRPRRRTFTAQDKLRTLPEPDRAADPGGVGAILRREGISSPTLGDWRRLRAAGAFGALVPVKRGPKTAEPNPLAGGRRFIHREKARLARRNGPPGDASLEAKKNSGPQGNPLAPRDGECPHRPTRGPRRAP